jgi:hypothetical protein
LAAHEEQKVDPYCELYLPRGQSVQLDVDTPVEFEYVPGGHNKHEDLFELGWNFPAGHSAHPVPLPYEPAVQLHNEHELEEVAPQTWLQNSAGHARQTDDEFAPTVEL